MKKKLLSVLALAAMSGVLLAGCGGTTETTAATTEATEAETTVETTAPDETEATDETTAPDETVSDEECSVQGALDGVSLIIGTSGTYAPFSYYADDGVTLQGYDIAMLGALQDILGFTIDGGELQAMDYTPLGTAISEGQLDVVSAALCATDTRKEVMNFTNTYYDAGIVVIVAPDNDTITSVDDLMGGDYIVAVQSGTVAYEYASENLPESCLQTYDSQSLAYKAVEGGQADATIYDAPGHGTAYSIGTGEINLKIVGDEFYNGQSPYAIALSFDICEQYPDIVEDFNTALAYLEANGTLAEIKAEWCE